MKTPEVSLLEWQKQYGTEEACIDALIQYRWPNGFICPECGYTEAYYITTRQLYECVHCKHQVSITAGTIFHSTKLPLDLWFWAIYLVAADKGSVSALRLSKLLGVSWPTAWLMLRKMRIAMGHRDSIYRLQNIIELDDALVGGKRSGKRGRGAEGKTPILIAVECRKKYRAGFMAIQVVNSIAKDSIDSFIKHHFVAGQTVQTDGLPAMNTVKEAQNHLAKVMKQTDPDKWLRLVHIVIGNLKKFINGTFHGVSGKYLQEYLNEYCYRFNRRFWEYELPYRLLNACLAHTPVKPFLRII